MWKETYDLCARKAILIFVIAFLASSQILGQTKPAEPDSVIESFQKAVELAHSGDFDSTKVLLDEALYWSLLNDTNQWMNRVKTIARIFQKKDAYAAVAILDHYIADATDLLGEYHKVTLYLNVEAGKVLGRRQVGAFHAAAVYYEKALDGFARDKRAKRNEAKLCHFLGSIYIRQGEIKSAIAYLERGIRTYHILDDSLNLAKLYSDLGVAYFDIQHLEAANHAYESALAYAKNNPKQQGRVLLNLANLFAQQKDYGNAAQANNEALKLFQEQNFLPGISSSYRLKAEIAMANNLQNEALHLLQEALRVGSKAYGKHHREVAKLHVAIGKQHQALKEEVASLEAFHRALVSMFPELDATDANAFPNRNEFYPEPWIMTTLLEKGNGYRAMYEFDGDPQWLRNAIESFELASIQADLLRAEYSYAQAKEKLAGTFHQLAESAIETALALAEHFPSEKKVLEKKAFAFAEKAKAASLMDFIQDLEARRTIGVSDSLMQAERVLRGKISYYDKQLFDIKKNGAEEGPDYEKTRDKIFLLDKSLKELTKVLKKEYENYFRLRTHYEPLSIERVQNMLGKEEVLIEYFLGEKSLIIFALRYDEWQVKSLKVDSSFNKRVRSFVSTISNPSVLSGTAETFNLYRVEGDWLREQLIDPIKQMTSRSTKRMIIVPDGILAYMPFEAIPTETSREKGFYGVDYMINHHAFVYLYSASLRSFTTGGLKENKKNCMVMAPEFSVNTNVSSTRGQNFLPLKFNLLEAKEVIKKTSGKGYLKLEASKESFIREANQYKIIHLATHGWLEDEEPLYSGLAFGETEGGRELMYAYELGNMKLNADLVVLSACNTGVGELVKGEGVISLARSFSYAGCKSTMMSMWEVNDQATATIMSHFYDAIGDGKEKDEALRYAKIKYLESADPIKSHPFFWAAFINVGDYAPIELEHSPGYLFWCIAFGLILLAALIYWRVQ